MFPKALCDIAKLIIAFMKVLGNSRTQKFVFVTIAFELIYVTVGVKTDSFSQLF